MDRVGCFLPLAVLNQLLGCHIVIPLLSLQNAQNELLIVIVLGWQGDSCVLQMLAKGDELFLFFLAQLLSKKDEPLVLTVVDCEENLVVVRLVPLALIIDVIQVLYTICV